MIIDVLTIFPGMFRGPWDESIIKRAREKGLVEVRTWDIRDFSVDKHRTVDDYSFGGGTGMVMKPEPIFRAVEEVQKFRSSRGWIILMCPQGRVFDQEKARTLSRQEHLIILCGHYEGIDERVRQYLVDEEISIGDYVLTGGELPAMVVVDAVVRLIPGVLGKQDPLYVDSFADGLLEYPQYTRPREFRGWRVPEVLVSGNHEAIRRWRRKEALRRTMKRRPDLLYKANLTPEDLILIDEIKEEEGRI